MNVSERLSYKYEDGEMNTLVLLNFSDYAYEKLREFAEPTEEIVDAVNRLGNSYDEEDIDSAIFGLEEALDKAMLQIEEVKSTRMDRYETPKHLLLAIMTSVVREPLNMLQKLSVLVHNPAAGIDDYDSDQDEVEFDLTFTVDPKMELAALEEWIAREERPERQSGFGLGDVIGAFALGFVFGDE
ncbi:hypothetical protein [Maridesulfovibrio sp.]|uniref:hypothetical protein n=1 Tax=Maridesulfovibrio sp. TaxID=2795000 RepID=UPI0029CA313F|nr:hypothetical protein [Maridesulfovibrio sp.]